MKYIAWITCLLLLSFMLPACQDDDCPPCSTPKVNTSANAVDGAKALATVNQTPIGMDDYKARMERQSPYIRARYKTLEKKKEFLDNMIRFELLAQEAIRQGLDQDPEVLRSFKQTMIQKLMRKEFEEKIKPESIAEEELKAYFEANKKDFNKPAMVRAAHILVKVPADAGPEAWKEAKKKADQIYKEVKETQGDPNAFRRLAAKHSDDAGNRHRGGDLGYFASTAEGGPMPQAFSDAAFAMKKINDISPPVKSERGYHVIKLTGKRNKIERSFEQVKGQIQQRLYKDKRTQAFDDFVNGLKKKSSITVNEEMLKSYSVSGEEKPADETQETLKKSTEDAPENQDMKEKKRDGRRRPRPYTPQPGE